MIYRLVAEVKGMKLEHKITKTAGATFTDLIKRECQAVGIDPELKQDEEQQQAARGHISSWATFLVRERINYHKEQIAAVKSPKSAEQQPRKHKVSLPKNGKDF